MTAAETVCARATTLYAVHGNGGADHKSSCSPIPTSISAGSSRRLRCSASCRMCWWPILRCQRIMRELVAYASQHPDALTFGTSGAGTASHLAAELFNLKAWRPRSCPCTTPAAATKRWSICWPAASRSCSTWWRRSLPRSRRAISGRSGWRSPNARPSCRRCRRWRSRACRASTSLRSGLAFGARRRLPQPIIDLLSRAANEALKTEDVGNALKAQASIGRRTAAEFRSFIAPDTERWTAVVRSAGLSN